ncbi:MAG: hypothetical protein JRI80_16635 [Deltaproteobacteria bacterium]|nr:hypothetical protein [Deltaproteobacteria bacterium]
MDAVTLKQGFQLKVSGYVSEVLCGEIPARCKQAFTRYLLGNRNAAEIPSWVIKRCPHYVSPEEIKQLWYRQNAVMHDIFAEQDFSWIDYRQVNQFLHTVGFGSGKEGLGLFEMVLEKDGNIMLEFVPFEPPIESAHPLVPINRLKQEWLKPPAVPSPREGFVAVSSGSWAKGTIVYPLQSDTGFQEEALEILVTDLSAIGIGEDHFVAGLRYGGQELRGQIIRETDREMHQVVWYSRDREKWLDMYELGEA